MFVKVNACMKRGKEEKEEKEGEREREEEN